MRDAKARLLLVAAMVAAVATHACGTDELGGADVPRRASPVEAPGGAAGDAPTLAAAAVAAQGGAAGVGDAPTPPGDGGNAASSGGEGGRDASAGQGGTPACVPEPVAAPSAGPVHGLSLRQVSVLQAVDVPIMERMLEIPSRKVALVAGRAGLLRVYVLPEPGWHARTVRARLILERDGETSSYEQTSLVATASTDADASSTFNFELPAEVFSETTSYAVELSETQTCVDDAGDTQASRFPAEGTLSLRVVAAPNVRVLLVPVEQRVGDETFLPDTSPEQLELLRREVVKLFPIADVELSVRQATLPSTAVDILGVLDEVTALRDEENTDPGLSYYGLVRFGAELSSYCAPTCVLGASTIGEVPSGGTAVGIGYAVSKAAVTFAHELGHVYGRPHSPCGVAGDPAFPYAGGGIGVWGYDIFEQKLIDPGVFKDFMGYCTPTWVSDHTFELLREFIAQVPAPNSLEASASGQRFRTLIRPANGSARWGRSRIVRGGVPPGRPEDALVRDAAGAERARVAVHRVRLDDDGSELIYVPEPVEPGWQEVRIHGWAPQAFEHESD